MSVDDSAVYLVIAAAFFGFIALAFVLLFPIYRFLRKEERASGEWTQDAIVRRQRREQPIGDGAPGAAPPVKTPDEPGGG
ncbi:MAG: hypothetical protein ACK41D_09560 [Rubricoccaceae bacterium]